MSLFLLGRPLLSASSPSPLTSFGGCQSATSAAERRSLEGDTQRWEQQAFFSLIPGSLLPSDIIFHPWKKEENGNQSRVILYTITLTNPLAPKTATVRETQVS